ncbi:MAG TPA: response regulator transcription factor [Actinomycetota bacterium]|nr:response regulator transcription factor [Candidatus Nanopelagicales bacterium]HPQ84628.1 response regulator transcription factor [Actinomycetota bacterium]
MHVSQGPEVLVVDDEIDLAEVVAGYLQAEGFSAALAHTGPDAVEAARTGQPRLVVLDVMLPGFDGIEVCRRIRTFSDCYIIMLTARDDEVDKVLGLSIGADDYLVKPFSPRELMARIKAMLRRPRAMADHAVASSTQRTLGDLVVDTEARRVWRAGDELTLTRTEFDLLEALTDSPRRAFSRRQLIDRIWGPDWFGDEHVVDVHIGHLRRKLADDANSPRYIRTVRGIGYGMVLT